MLIIWFDKWTLFVPGSINGATYNVRLTPFLGNLIKGYFHNVHATMFGVLGIIGGKINGFTIIAYRGMCFAPWRIDHFHGSRIGPCSLYKKAFINISLLFI